MREPTTAKLQAQVLAIKIDADSVAKPTPSKFMEERGLDGWSEAADRFQSGFRIDDQETLRQMLQERT